MTKEHIIFYSVAAATLVAGGLGLWGYKHATSKAEAKLGITHSQIEKGYAAIDAAADRAIVNSKNPTEDMEYICNVGDTYKKILSYPDEKPNFFEKQLIKSANKLSDYATSSLVDLNKTFVKYYGQKYADNLLSSMNHKIFEKVETPKSLESMLD